MLFLSNVINNAQKAELQGGFIATYQVQIHYFFTSSPAHPNSQDAKQGQSKIQKKLSFFILASLFVVFWTLHVCTHNKQAQKQFGNDEFPPIGNYVIMIRLVYTPNIM